MLKVEALSRQSQTGQTLLKQVNLSLSAGECLGLSGPSGSGKSVLLRALAGLDALQTGNLQLFGQSLSAWAMPDYRSQVMYLPQKPVFVPGTARFNLDLPLGFKVYRLHRPPEIPWQALGLTPDFGSRDISRLSGGERQKLALLRALRLKPQILLLDEPTAAMDPESGKQAEALILQWLSQPQRACIWVSHQPPQLARVASRQLKLVQGCLQPTPPDIQEIANA